MPLPGACSTADRAVHDRPQRQVQTTTVHREVGKQAPQCPASPTVPLLCVRDSNTLGAGDAGHSRPHTPLTVVLSRQPYLITSYRWEPPTVPDLRTSPD